MVQEIVGYISLYPVLAYIDPGTGSMILQLLLGGVAGVWIILKLFGQRILAFFGKKPKADPSEK